MGGGGGERFLVFFSSIAQIFSFSVSSFFLEYLNLLFYVFLFEEDITPRGDVGSLLMGGIIVRLDWISPQSRVTANLDLKSTKPPKIAKTPNNFCFR